MTPLANPANVSDPVRDSVPKVDNAIAVGEDLAFQRKWWRFEHIVWAIFVLILIVDALGGFGRGFLAKAERHTGDKTIDLKYERIERASTPSILTINFGQSAVAMAKSGSSSAKASSSSSARSASFPPPKPPSSARAASPTSSPQRRCRPP